MNKKGQLKVILAAVLQGIVIFIMVESAHGQNWVYVTETNDTKFYYDKDSISRLSPNIVRFWTKNVSSPSNIINRLKKEGKSIKYLIDKGYEQYSFSIWYNEFNCREKTSIDLSNTDYDIQGSELETITFSKKDKVFIPPGTAADEILKVLCK